MLTTVFNDLIGCPIPLQNAGMGSSSPRLAVAVAKAGALGMLSGAMMPAERLENILDGLDDPAPGRLGVNFLMPFLEDPEVVDVAAERVRVVEFFYGDPEPSLVVRAKKRGALVSWQVGSVEEAKQAVAADCDFVVVQGVEGGGHIRGRVSLMTLLPSVLEVVEIPVVAAGGIATPRAMAAALVAGAAAVRVGTRFAATPEVGHHPEYLRALVNARMEDAVYTDKFSIMWNAPHRVLRGALEAAEAFEGDIVGQVEVDGQKLDVPRLSVFSPIDTATGEVGAMAQYAGQSVGEVTSIQPAAEIVRELAAGAEELLRSRLSALTGERRVPSSPEREEEQNGARRDGVEFRG